MRTRIIILLVAVVLGLVAAFVAGQYIRGARQSVEQQEMPVEVLVAQEDLAVGLTAGEIISEGYVEVVTIPRRYVSEGAVSSFASIEGQVVVDAIAKGEQVSAARFQYPTEAGLAFSVPEDFVAVALPSDARRGVANLVSPGDHVAVLATFEPTSELKDAVTKTIIGKARVLAVGSQMADQPVPTGGEDEEESSSVMSGAGSSDMSQGPDTITVALSSVDAEKVVFAAEEGTVWFTLLSSESADVAETEGQKFPGILE